MKIIINQKAVQRWNSGHPWIFRSDLIEVEMSQPGPVSVVTEKGKLLGEALYSPKSLIALRRMSMGSEKITESLIRERIEKAYQWRKEIFPNETAYRVVFGEADGLPSLIIDRFGDVVAFQSLSAGMELFKECIVQTLKKLFQPRSILERNDAVIREKEGLPLLRQVVWGEDPKEVRFDFGGKTFSFEPLEGQKTGFFLDQRFNALEAGRLLKGEILDAFCYVGQFGILASSRASQLTFVDSSEKALDQTKKNAQANGISSAEFHSANVFDYLKDCDQKKRRFDGVSLDPPAFVKSRAALKGALAGYKEINLRAMRLLNPGGILVTSSCSQHLRSEDFEMMLVSAARDAKRHVQILEKRGQPIDHPILLSMPESEYLKCYILRLE